MDEKRLQAYVSLIQMLLSCPSGKEPEILNSHQDLVDGELVQVMQQVAESLAQEGNKDAAEFLTNVTGQLGKALGLSSTSPTFSQLPTADSQLNFLMEVLRATAKSKGNPQVVYPLLQANLDKLDDYLAVLLRHWGTVTLAEVEPELAQGIAVGIFNFSNLIAEFPLGSRAINLEIAITGYEVVGTVFTRESFPQDWANTQNNLANAYLYRIRGQKADNLEAAIKAFQAALQVRTPEAFPQEWAGTQNNLANAYSDSDRIRGQKADNLEAAITAYQAALQVRTREAFPQQWAMTQNNLGNAYRQRIRGQKADNLEDAINAYQGALQVYTREAFPVDWASAQNNLAVAYSQRIRGQKADNLEAAINGFQAALQVRTREAFPVDWAMTQNNLASTYCHRIRGQKADNLEAAINGFQAALQVRTREAFPVDWAGTQHNLASTYCQRIRGQKADNLEATITAYQGALQVYTREAFPVDWARTQNNLAVAYSDRIRGKKADNLEDAINAYQGALQVRTREAFPVDWARTQHNLGIAYTNRIRGQKADNLEAAIKAFQGALQVLTRKAFPFDWAMTQYNLAVAYSDRIRGQKADNLEDAIKACQGALQVLTREAFPVDWASAQNNLGIAYTNRIRGQKADNLEAAITAYQAALQVYTRQTFPVDWARTQNNLASTYCQRIRGQKADNLEAAITAYQAALQVRTREAFPQNWATTQNNLASTYCQRIRGQKADNLEAAITAYQAALQVRTREAFPQNHAETLFNLGLAYQDAQQLTNAYHTFAEAIETVESLRGEIISGSGVEADKQKLAEEWHKLYSSMVEVCLELNKPTEAIEYAERSKARNLVELLANKNLYPKRDRYPNPEVHQAHCQQLDQLRREIPVIQRELEIVTRNRESEEKYHETIKTNQQRLKGLKQQQDNLLKEINQLDLSFQFTQQVEPIPFSDIQTLIDDHTAIIQWYITDNQILTFIITSQNQHPQVRQFYSEDRKALFGLTLEYLVTYYRKKYQWKTNLNQLLSRLTQILHIEKIFADYYQKKYQWETNLDQLLRRLAQILHIEEILAELPQECDQLIFIPHRLLHLFPLHALPIENREQQANNSEQNTHTNNAYLLDLFPKGVRYAPSCQLLQLSQNQQRPDFSKLFAIQNPTNDSYKNLYYADLEVNNILPLFSSSQVLAKQAATEAAVKTSQEMSLSHCHHFSCHGQFNPISPQESALILAKDDSPEDGRLTVAEIFGLSLNQCRLVSLSACETGITKVFGSTSDQYSSDEYISLPSGFLYAGSPSVVSSLWTVNEFPTAFLMIKFYQNLSQFTIIETGAVAVALNQAQIWLRDVTKEELEEWTNHLNRLYLTPNQNFDWLSWFSKMKPKEQPFQSPYYWAAFCAIGK
ncbi:CHAT domain-containing protein [Moorena sp. SIO3I6]|uniref:CHAT domain-containing protein n=1 Tax=Moorena sp. SIO3I6 TaxID=2607831 RepID=UPI0013FB7282|nr:CHAT domain-containing protein [Moorena sp. SIO3I6]NEP22755.1 tetratricopeptide repeat protein [Moorena sp. SIO3I6]